LKHILLVATLHLIVPLCLPKTPPPLPPPPTTPLSAPSFTSFMYSMNFPWPKSANFPTFSSNSSSTLSPALTRHCQTNIRSILNKQLFVPKVTLPNRKAPSHIHTHKIYLRPVVNPILYDHLNRTKLQVAFPTEGHSSQNENYGMNKAHALGSFC
jgi:hypothetical protein